MKKRYKICGVLVDGREESLRGVECADIVEVRADLVGENWDEIPPRLTKPWIFTDRRLFSGKDAERRGKKIPKNLDRALSLGASFVDFAIEHSSEKLIKHCQKNGAKVVVSYHNFSETPPVEELRMFLNVMRETNADICKLATFANSLFDNAVPLAILGAFASSSDITAFCMGKLGTISRILAPVFGACFTYASAQKGLESAEGQLAVSEVRLILDKLENSNED
ncbi:MAG: type I 3-dehydroquinate dehydratase [Planctomycetota bacterium]|nr:type I 3-dehydroquinate dehydratase [Planctomycetota bacterium]